MTGNFRSPGRKKNYFKRFNILNRYLSKWVTVFAFETTICIVSSLFFTCIIVCQVFSGYNNNFTVKCKN